MSEWINGISKPKVYEIEDFLDDVKDSRIEALERENARLREALGKMLGMSAVAGNSSVANIAKEALA